MAVEGFERQAFKSHLHAEFKPFCKVVRVSVEWLCKELPEFGPSTGQFAKVKGGNITAVYWAT